MSKSAEMASDDEVKALSKKERREQKEKKEKKEKKRSRTEPEVDAADPDTGDETAATPAKKRKRDALPDEIEIDVNLPEPASKKAARKAKKAKTNPSATDDKDGAAAGQAGAQTKEDKEQAGKRSDFGVWIGNLPWSATKDSLRDFLVEHAEMKPAQITRVHLPPPTKPANPNWTTKPLNKGFAYVDFSTELAMYSAIALTETKMDGRALLIKNAKNFEGRPDKPKTEEAHDSGRGGKGAAKPTHPPNKRVFVGNLSFDVTKEDLQAHYAPCGPVEHIHMATFEDSGKCKGYAWVTFADVEASTAAVKGFVFKDESAFKNKDKKNSDDEGDSKQSGKQRKWFVSKLFGRDLRCEFAEDSTTRYNKRYGKDKPESHEPVDGVNPDRWKNFGKGGDERGGRREAQEGRPRKKVDPRTIKSGAAHSNAPRASQAIVASEGKRTTFD